MRFRLPMVLLAVALAWLPAGSTFAAGLRFGFGVDLAYSMPEIPDALQTVPAHPADSPTGETTADLEPYFNYAFKLNLRVPLYESGDSLLYGGVDLGVGPATSAYREGIYDTELCDYGGESYAYVQLIPSYFSAAPVLGLQYSAIFAEISFPYTGFTLENGHDRYGDWEEVEKYEWQGFGQRYLVGFSLYDKLQPGIYYENYTVDFGGHQAIFNVIGLRMAYYLY